ncbi:Cohesin domain-containing protein [Methanolobus vulcani]|jgi:Cohesin domain.|uniref:Cohesin domain-containing protein n=1 Tax=Methanolobus vulcani TaxID=38026 RepID=A0A7Z7AZ91_9EURY|nr:cohesin domain-containing protein [Methanolobus vulcani]SDG37193.1 Cohesin domain-containing protein [Methanolobus vulcani]
MWSINNLFRYSALALLVFVAATVNASAAASVFISPESSTVSPGETFTVDVNVNSGIDDLRALSVKIDYDPAVLEVLSITEEDLIVDGSLIEPESGDDGDGTIIYGFATLTDENSYAPGSGTFISIEFQVKDTVEDDVYHINFENVRLKDKNNDEIQGTATGSSVIVGNVAAGSVSSPEIIDFGSPAESGSTGSSSGSITTMGSSIDTGQQLSYEYIFGSHPDDYRKLVSKGIVPSEEEWDQNLPILESNIKNELEDRGYLFSRGKIISVGANSGGYLVIVFYEPLMVEGEEVDATYEVIRQKAMEMNVTNVPVEFGEGTVPEASARLQNLLQKAQAMNAMKLESLMDNESSLYDPEIIAVAGEVPLINTEKECWQWYYQDSYAISLNMSDPIAEYLQNGILLNTGLSTYGYFEVKINQEADINRKSLITDVYGIINTAAMKVGVNNVPVVFKVVNPDVAEDVLASTNDEVPEENPTSETEAQQSPGFGFLISLLSLSLVYCMAVLSGKRKP